MIGYYFRLAWCRLRKAPWLSLLMIVTLAVGQATSMVTLTLRHALSGDPIPDKSTRLLMPQVKRDGGHKDQFTYAQASRLASLVTPSLIMGQAIGDVARLDRSLVLSGEPVRYTTRQFFDFFNVPLAQGRGWDQQEDEQGAPVAVLSQGAAHALFPAGNALRGRIALGDVEYRVIGVLGAWNPVPRYYDLGVGGFVGADVVFVPLQTIRYAPPNLGVPMTCVVDSSGGAQPAAPAQLLDADCDWLTPWFLAGNGDARALTRKIVAALPAVMGDASLSDYEVLNVHQLLAAADLMPASVNLYTALGLAFLGLCIVNAAGMQLARITKHASETGVRRALGARRVDIVLQYLSEAALIGLMGGALGVGLSLLGLQWVRGLPSSYTRVAIMDATMVGATMVLVLLCCLLTGLVPAILASRADPALVIKVQS